MAQVSFNIPSLEGMKTYLVAGLTIAYGGWQIYQGNMNEGILTILGGSGLGALRAGVSKSGPEPVVNQVADMVAKAIELQPPCREEPPNPTPLAAE